MAKPTIILIGAPRSGISILGECLSKLGLHALDERSRAEISTINRLLFQDTDHSPTMVGPLPQGWLNSYGADKARGRIRGLLASRRNAGGLLFLADPLLCRILPLWMEAFQDQDLEPRFIHMVRHPYEVALSLQEDQDIDLLKGHLVWLAWVRDALTGSANRKSVLITFDQLMANPITTLNSAGRSLDIKFPIDLSTSYHALLNFVKPGLMHHHAGIASEADRKRFTPFNRFYDALQLLQAGAGVQATTHSSRGMMAIGDHEAVSGGDGLLDMMFQVLGHYEHKEHGLRTREERLLSASHAGQALFATLSIPTSVGEYRAKRIPILPDQWQKITLDIPRPDLLNDTPLRFCPLNTTGAATISAVKLVNRATDEVLWSAQTSEDNNLVAVEGTALRVPAKDNLALLITGKEPVVVLTGPAQMPDFPARVEIWLKVSQNQGLHHESLRAFLSLESWKTLLGTTPQDSDSDNLLHLATAFEDAGCLAEADAVLRKGVEDEPGAVTLRMAFAELSMKRKDWPEAVRRWQDVAALQGESTPAQVYQRLDEAYQKQKSFPKGSPEEEVRIGDGDKHEMLSLIHRILAPEMYLEIGVQSGKSLALASCDAIGVDPMPQVSVVLSEGAKVVAMTSDDFFRGPAVSLVKNPPDLVFIDGMHLFEHTLRDFMHVERMAAPWTLVVIDDIFPAHPAQAERRRRTRAWTGDVWKIYEILSRYRPDLFLLPVNTSPTGLLLIAGFQPANQVLWNNYDAIVSKYSAGRKPPEAILKRDGVLSSRHDAIPRILAALKTGREELLESVTIISHLEKELTDACNGSRPRFPFM